MTELLFNKAHIKDASAPFLTLRGYKELKVGDSLCGMPYVNNEDGYTDLYKAYYMRVGFENTAGHSWRMTIRFDEDNVAIMVLHMMCCAEVHIRTCTGTEDYFAKIVLLNGRTYAWVNPDSKTEEVFPVVYDYPPRLDNPFVYDRINKTLYLNFATYD